MKIELNANEVLVASYVGMRRNAEAQFKGRKNRFPNAKAGDGWGRHIESAHAELAVAKAFGLYWGFGVNTFGVSDIVNTKIEVRWTPERRTIKVKDEDADDAIVVGVTGESPRYEIIGWVRATEAKHRRYLYDGDPPCYFVPEKHTNEPMTLFDELKKALIDQMNK